MKKLVVLMLVLGLATMANAVYTGTGLSGDASGDNNVGAGNIDLGITDGAADTYLAVGIIGDGAITIASAAVTGLAVDLIGTFADLGLEGTYGQGFIYGYVDSSIPYEYPDGEWMSVNYSGAVNGDVITFYETDGETYVFLDSVTIPEPMTLALLGLGGLFLRRKS